MKALPKKYKLLKEISNLLNEYLNSANTSLEIRSNELYEIASKVQYIKSEFPSNKSFNQFLRKQHQEGTLSSFLTYRVDTFNNDFYQWYFRKKSEKKENVSLNNTTTLQGTFNYYKNSKNIFASDGTKLNSSHEIIIYEELKKHSNLLIKIEHPVTKFGETKFADFIIKNTKSNKEFIWEHFGMTNNEIYKTKMADKIEWYKKNGFINVEEGGFLIYTYYNSDHKLKKDIVKYINIITDVNYLV